MEQLTGYFRDMWSGPGHFRFFIQPALALILGGWDGYRDARKGRTAFLLGLIRESETREQRLREGLRSILIPLVLAFILSSLFQFIIRSRISLVGALLYAAVFVAFPYGVTRSLSNRLTKRLRSLLQRPIHP